MNILINAIYRNGGAVFNMMKGVGEELCLRGHEVFLLVDSEEALTILRSERMQICSYPSARGRGPLTLRDYLYFVRILRNFKPQAVILMFEWVSPGMILSWLFRITHRLAWQRSVVTMLRSGQRVPRWKIWRMRLILKLAERILCNSKANARSVREILQVPEEKISVLFNIIENYGPQAGRITARSKNLIVCVGELASIKEQGLVVKAVGLLRNQFPDLQLEIIGSGPEEGTLRALVRSLGLEDRCFFTGYLPYPKVFERIGRAALQVVPSCDEAFGNVVVEAMSMRTPVIATDISAFTEIIEDGKDGLLFRSRDHGDLAEKIRLLLSDEDLRQRLGMAALEKFKIKYNLASHISSYTDSIETLLR